MKQNTNERRAAKRQIISTLETAGVNFKKSVFCLNSDERQILGIAAARNHYKRPAGAYFIHLQKFI